MARWRNVAVIAPASDLDWVENEVRTVIGALRPLVLRGTVTIADVVDLVTGTALDCLWFSGHGGREGIQLSDGLLSTARLIQLVKQCGARLVVLNSCESEQTGAWIYLQTGAAVICTIADVGDQTAWITASLLARNLARDMDIEAAYNRSKPGDVGQANVYRLFNFKYNAGQETERTLELWTLVLQPINEKLDQLADEVGKVKKSLGHLSEISMTVHPTRRLAWVIGALLFAAPFLVSGLVNLWLHQIPLLYAIPAVILDLSLSIMLLAWGLSFWKG